MMHTASSSWRRYAALILMMVLLVPVIAACGGTTAPADAPAADSPTAAPAADAPAADSPTAAPAADAPAADSPTAAPAADAPTADAGSASSGGSGRGAGGTLRILYWQAPTILNAHLATGTKDYDAARLILEPLVAVPADGTPVPILAEEVPTVANGGVSEDLTTVTWKLKQGVTWSDGTPFTADDVTFTYEYCSTEATACTNSTNFANVASIEAVDEHTVKVTWDKPNPNIYQMFSSFNGYIIQKAQFGNCVGENASTDGACQQANNAPIGTGPYKLKEFKPGDVVTYEVNENYRDADKPYFSEVQFKGGGDATSAARAVFQTGDVDYAWNLQVEAAVLSQLQQGGQADLLTIDSPNLERILMNFTNPDPALGEERGQLSQPHPFLTDINVRKAMAMAIDRKVMAEQLYGPAGGPSCHMITTEPYRSPDQAFDGTCDADIEGAKKLLEDAGWVDDGSGVRAKDGVKLSVLFQTSTNPLRQKEQALVKQAWEAIGIATELKNVDAGVFFDSDAGNPDTIGHFFTDVQMYTNGSSQPDQTDYLCGWISSEASQKENGWRLNNNNRYTNSDYDALCDQLRTETDEAKRKDIVLQMDKFLIDDVVNIPLVARKSVSGASTKLGGLAPSGWDSEMWNIAEWTMEP